MNYSTTAAERRQTLKRRLITIPAFLLAFAVVWLLLPLWLLLALVVDVVKQWGWLAVRCTLALAVYLFCELCGIMRGLVLWPVEAIDKARSLRYNFAFQKWWLGTMYGAISWLFSLQTNVSNDEVLDSEVPILVFARHVSHLDTFLPAVLISKRHGIFLRYVLKEELRWSPTFDLIARRLLNYFVRRKTMASRREIDNVARLSQGLSNREGVLIYPEGTRFSPEKRDRLVRVMRRHADASVVQRAQGLRHLLPPQLGGSLALLNAIDEGTDVVFMAHTGFEGIRNVNDLFSEDLVGRQVHVHFWRVPHAELPCAEAAQVGWLFDQWERMDAWVDQHMIKTMTQAG